MVRVGGQSGAEYEGRAHRGQGTVFYAGAPSSRALQKLLEHPLVEITVGTQGQGRGVSSLFPQIQSLLRATPLPPPLHPAGSRLCFSLRGSRLQEAEMSMRASSPSPLASLWVRPLSNTGWGVGGVHACLPALGITCVLD